MLLQAKGERSSCFLSFPFLFVLISFRFILCTHQEQAKVSVSREAFHTHPPLKMLNEPLCGTAFGLAGSLDWDSYI